MKLRIAHLVVAMLSVVFSLTSPIVAQTSAQTASALPHLVRFGGTAKDHNGSPLSGVVGITFALYSEQTGGAPLWLETQSVTADSNGHYVALLGATKPEGLPGELFTSELARWVGVQVSGQAEQARVLLVSAPYALKAGDAETIGGLPPSAFMLAAPPISSSIVANSTAETVSPSTAADVTTTGGTADYLAIFSGADTLIDSAVFQAGSGTTAKVGIDTSTPATPLDVNGAGTIRGTLSLPARGTASAKAGKNSQGLNLSASAWNTLAAVNQTFRWQAEPVGNGSATPTGTMNLLFGAGTATPAETGLRIASNGQITFAAGQMFPGTVSEVTAGIDLTAGGTAGNVTLNLNTAATNALYARLAANNTFTGTQTINNTTIISGTNSAGVLQVTNTTTSGKAPAIVGTTDSAAAAGIKGIVAATSGTEAGVVGQTSSPEGDGVQGHGPYVGVYGAAGGASGTGAASTFNGAGVWGDAGSPSKSGVMGTADDGIAGYFLNNSPQGYGTLVVDAASSASTPFAAYGPGGSCSIDQDGNLNCTGAKNAVVPIDGSKRIVAMSAIESPQNWFEDFGSAQLASGIAIVTLDATFIQTVNTEMDYKVFPVPNGDCKGLFVTHKTPTSFEVRELGGGTSNVSFDYRITAIRKKYENVRFADHTHDLDGSKRIMLAPAAHPVIQTMAIK
jgi:hypothetical protein